MENTHLGTNFQHSVMKSEPVWNLNKVLKS